jgi:hypothetical protein
MLLDSVPQLGEHIYIIYIDIYVHRQKDAGKTSTCLVVQGLIHSRDVGFSLLQNLQTGSRAHPASQSMGTGRNKTGHESDC